MKLQNPTLQKYKDALRSWPAAGGGVHGHLMTVANLAALSGVPESDGMTQARATMPRPPNPPNEIETTFAKAYAEKDDGRRAPGVDYPLGWDSTIGGDAKPGAAPHSAVRVSLYRNATDNRGQPADLAGLLADIRAGRWASEVEAVRSATGAARDAAKRKLPGFTPAGLFKTRGKVGLDLHSGLVVADVDKLASPDDAERVRGVLAADPHTVAAFVSPSGLGVKALVRVEPCTDAAEHEAAFNALVAFMSAQHGIALDTSGRDASRLCFVSCDPGAFIRPGAARPFNWRNPEPAADIPEAENVRPYATRAWDELGRMLLTPPEIVWGGFALGASCAIFGQGGLGKSRLVLNIARNQVLGMPFAGLPTASRPLRHLMMGSENSIHRLQYDIRKMNGGLTAEQIATLGAHIRLATLEGPEDTFISLASPVNVERWRLTIEEHRPDVLWCDPWGDVLDGDSNGDDDARATLSALRRLLRRVNKDAGLGILAHSRTGAANILQAVGYDAANFGKGSKALYSSARCVWNLAPGSESEDPPLVCAHAKSNDSPKEKPFAVRLDPETMTYHREDDFDLVAWQADLSAHARGKRGPKKGPTMTEEQAVEILGEKVGTSAEVIQILRDKGATKDNATDLRARLVLSGTWEQWQAPVKNGATYIGSPAALKLKRAEVVDKLQKKLKVG